MVLSPIGKIAQEYWVEIPDHFKHIELDEFVVMPNHIHGIIIINDNRRDTACFSCQRSTLEKYKSCNFIQGSNIEIFKNIWFIEP